LALECNCQDELYGPGCEALRKGPYSNDHHRRTAANDPKGKVAELRAELNTGGKRDKNHAVKKIALKRIVANMTMSNNDMIALFPDVISCMQIPSLEIKKMSVMVSWLFIH
jgi:hypothetical protein